MQYRPGVKWDGGVLCPTVFTSQYQQAISAQRLKTGGNLSVMSGLCPLTFSGSADASMCGKVFDLGFRYNKNFKEPLIKSVIPAKAGTHSVKDQRGYWIPACAGMT